VTYYLACLTIFFAYLFLIGAFQHRRVKKFWLAAYLVASFIPGINVWFLVVGVMHYIYRRNVSIGKDMG
jgi:hypothetical protein